MQTDVNLRSWLDWLVKVRIIIITFLLGIGLVITQMTTTNTPVRAFVALILLWYTISVFYVVLVKVWREHWLQARLQVLTDLCFATGLVYVTGGVDTYFNFLFPLIIIVAAMILPRWWAFATASTAFIFFGAVLELGYFGVIRSYQTSSRGDLKSLQAVILINLFAYIAIAYLASTLVAKLRQVDIELQDRSGELLSLKALHQNIIDSMYSGVITTDLQGRVTLINQAGERLLERKEAELLDKQVAGVFLDRLPAPESQNVAGPAHVEARSLTPRGEAKTFAVTVSQLHVAERGAVGYVYAFDDLTRLRRLEREVRMRDRLAAVGRMAAGIAHEIRNPLAAIAGSVTVLKGEGNLSRDQQQLLDIVTRESERLNGIISDFLIYSREKTYKFTKLNLVDLLEDTLMLLENRPEVSEGQIKIVREFSTRHAFAEVDGDKFKQVFWNLSENALRAMLSREAPGERRLTVSLEAKDDAWRIVFADTGKGISPEQMEKLFEPFQSSFTGGTGLGLAIVYQIVQAHEARIWVRSAEGVGTQVYVEMQAAVKRDEAAQSKVTHG